jgi:DNA-binding transcriptional LysR family regulator
VATEALLLVVAPFHPLATRRSITLEELYRLELAALSPASGTDAVYSNELEASGIVTARLRTTRQVGSLDALRAFVAAGLVAAFVPAAAAREALAAGSLVQLPVERAEPRASAALPSPSFTYIRQCYFRG